MRIQKKDHKKIQTKKKGVLGMALAMSLVMAGSFSTNAAGNWIETKDGWKYKDDDGKYAKYMYIDGWYLNENGIQTGDYQASWKKDSKGWWYGDDSGWYAKDDRYYIDGEKYDFDSSGYLIEYGWKKNDKGWYYQFDEESYASAEWIDGYWIGADGYWNYKPRGQWYEDEKGKYYMDSSGYYEKNQGVFIDGEHCKFDGKGYLVEYTHLESNDKNTEVKFNVSLDTKDEAAKQLQSLLTRMIDNGESVKVKLDGTEKNAQNNNGIISFDGKILTDYINEVSVSQTEVEVSMSTTTKKIFSTIFSDTMLTDDYRNRRTASEGADKFDHYDYKMTLGGVTFSNFIFTDKYVTYFDVGGKQLNATPAIWPNEEMGILPALDVEGKHLEDDWLKKLVDSGVIDEEVYITR